MEPDDGRRDDRPDFAYAPPFAPVWDPILVAARQAAGAVRQAGAGRR